MSGFLSSKYLKYQQARIHERIEQDLPCAKCGYNVRGLTYAGSCPECSAPIERGAGDVLLSGDDAERRAWRLGLALASGCLVGAVAARLLLFVVGFGVLSPLVASAYLWLGFALSLVWMVAAWLITPAALGRRRIFMGQLRLVVRVSQLFWPVAYAAWIFGRATQPSALLFWATALRLLAGIGAIVLALMLVTVATAAQRETAARRLNAVVWLLPILTLLPQAFPQRIQWLFLVPLGMILLAWAWVMMLYAMGVGELHQHVRWTMLEASVLASRDERVSLTRKAMDRELAASVRPPPPSLPDIPMEPPERSPRRTDRPSDGR